MYKYWDVESVIMIVFVLYAIFENTLISKWIAFDYNLFNLFAGNVMRSLTDHGIVVQVG